MQFNTEQQEAILHQKGPAFVLAGPGSGKTALLLGRIEALIYQKHISPSHIAALSFSRAAAREIEDRFIKRNPSHHAVYFGTIHAFFYQILKTIRPDASWQILTSSKRKSILAEAAAYVKGKPLSAAALALLEESLLKEQNEVISEQPLLGIMNDEEYQKIRAAYQSIKKARGLMDFEDILKESESLLANKDILHFWQKQFPYILVDEFQDVGKRQYRLLKTLCGTNGNLFAIGDDDQTIYGFRGAKAAAMLDFRKDFPGAALYSLKQNYRSTCEILAAASSLIEKNEKRFVKDLISTKGNGEAPVLRRYPSFSKECEEMGENIKDLIRRGINPEEIAVLARSRERLRRIGIHLMLQNIPVLIPEGIGDETLGICDDIFSFLRIAKGKGKREDYLRIINKPMRYISRRSFIAEDPDPQHILSFHYNNKTAQRAFISFLWQIEKLGGLKPFAAVEYIRHEMLYEAYWREKTGGKGSLWEEVLNRLDSLQEEAAAFSDYALWEEAKIKLEPEGHNKADRDGKLQLLTMHGAKGLEFEAVFLPALWDEDIPGRRRSEEEAEEERRLLYVAMTRAKSLLQLSFSRGESGHEKRPCRFLREVQGLRLEDYGESVFRSGN